MKDKLDDEVERGRVIFGRFASTPDEHGVQGLFLLKVLGTEMRIIASNGAGWDHISVSPAKLKRTPTWEEMECIKQMWFEPEETVVQFHPKQSEYKNFHPYVLHLWRDQTRGHRLPPPQLI